jgi:hypothetical protein
MNLKKCLVVIIVGSLWQNGAAQEPPSTRLQITARDLPVTLNIDANGATNFVLQHSQDLKIWRPSLHVFSKLRSFRLVDRSTSDGFPSPRFYRAVSNTRSVDQMLEDWRSKGFRKYDYRFQRTCFCSPFNLSATVTVNDGEVVAVSNVQSNGEPITPPDLSQFRSIEELFALVKDEAPKADFLAVEIDDSLQFPSFIDIDYYVLAADDEIQYQASAVQLIQ